VTLVLVSCDDGNRVYSLADWQPVYYSKVLTECGALHPLHYKGCNAQ